MNKIPVKKLNPKAPVFNPNEQRNRSEDQVQKESTAQWVNITFGGNLVTTNKSCQEIPS